MPIRAYQVITALLGVTCVFSVWKYRELAREVDNVYGGRANVRVVDDASNEPLSGVGITFPAKGAGDRWPKDVGAGSGAEGSFQVFWVSPHPITFIFGLDGYDAQALTLDTNSPREQTIKLHRKAQLSLRPI